MGNAGFEKGSLMATYEYTVVALAVKSGSKAEEGMNNLLAYLNELGSQGWEIVTGGEILSVGWTNNINARDTVLFMKRQTS